MDLAERQKELGVLTDLYGRSLQNRGQVALIVGGVASGKTKLLNTFADYATDSGAIALTATAAATERSVPFGTIVQLFHGALLPDAVEERVAPLLDAVVSGDARPDGLLIHALSSVLLDMAKDQPVLLGIDDVQFADEMSLRALLYLMRRIRSARLLVVLNEWAMPRPRHVAFHTEVARLPYFSRLRLLTLSPGGVAEVISRHVDTVTATRMAKSWHQVSGGNPLLVHALLEDHLTLGATGQQTEPVAGNAFNQAVLACLHRWEPELLDVARGIAVLGENACPSTLASLLDVPADTAAQVVDVLTMAGLLRDGDFRHPASKAAVLADLPPRTLCALHVGSARLLHRNGAPSALVADHLLAGGQPDDGDWVIDVLRDAAEHALADDNAERAVACLDLAHRACTDERERATLTTMLAHVEWRVRPAAASHRIEDLRSALRAGHLPADHAMTLVKYLLWHGQPDDAAKILSAMITTPDAANPHLHTDLRIAYRLLSYSHPPSFPVLPETAIPEHRSLLHLANEPARQASAALAAVLCEGPADAAIAAAEHVLQCSLLSDETLDSLLTALLALIYADRADKAAPWCDQLLDEARRRQAPTWQALLGNVRADIAIRAGDPLAAAEYARLALRLMSTQQWGVGIGVPLSTLLLATTAMGDYDDAAKLLKRTVPEGMHRTWFAPMYLHARGHYLLATDRPFAALGDFQTCGNLMTKWRIDHPAIAPWRTDAAQALVKLGRGERAGKLANEQLTLRTTGSRGRGTALRILAMTEPASRRVSLLEQAIGQLETCGDRLGLAAALGEMSRAHHAKDRLEEARSTAQRAMRIAKRAHAETLSRDLLAGWSELDLGTGAMAVDTPGMASLSRAEWRVASLAVLGHTNRAISRKLSITVSTVEQHLTRVYRKLNVNRRTELPVALPLRRQEWSSEPDAVGMPFGR